MLVDAPYLSSLQNNIRQRPIPWEGAVRAGNLTEDELKKIKAVDKVRKDQRKQTIQSDLDAYTRLLLGGDSQPSVLESAAKRGDVVQYILVLASDLIEDVPELKAGLLRHPAPYRPFVPLLSQSSNPEDPIPLLTAYLLTGLISSAILSSSKESSKIEEPLTRLYNYLSLLSKSSDSGLQDISVQEYSALLRTRQSRGLFWKLRKDTIVPLVDILRSAAGTAKDTSTLWEGSTSIGRNTFDSGLGGGIGLQLLYHVLLVQWQLSFEGALVGEDLESEHEIIPLYTHLLRLSPKEKTTRLLLSTLRNLLSTNETSLLPVAVLVRLPALLQNLKGRHLSDDDLLDDLQSLSDMLEEYTKTQTTFDQYAAEIHSGHLHWSPPHRNPVFWAENARRILDENKGELPKKLAEIISEPWDSDKQVLAIACNDIGYLVKEVPEKRGQLEKLGLKGRIMELMGESNEAVRWESLRAVGEWLRYSIEA
ncbi:ARM repeat-containing protein [Xylona heveae TC161]|uniref:V-type proton ATPase subunit H n=1 Tax=Xylona heveae (strain CBS 132557 / TC161) TaxID=1328760 RepID=A0A165GIT8_XYLHT|nr:ARM repeat-containing protein [Xylona heveae TC161]KZF22236.1 ARM repeat-containing protein [Xylona heveae TC161]